MVFFINVINDIIVICIVIVYNKDNIVLQARFNCANEGL